MLHAKLQIFNKMAKRKVSFLLNEKTIELLKGELKLEKFSATASEQAKFDEILARLDSEDIEFDVEKIADEDDVLDFPQELVYLISEFFVAKN